MKVSSFSVSFIFCTSLVASSPTLDPAFYDWHPPRPNDVRGPCPMLNTLANHGFIPRDGRELTADAVIPGLKKALNLADDISNIVWSRGLLGNSTPGADRYSLETLRSHPANEHDASISRADYYPDGNSYKFNKTIFKKTLAYWPTDILTYVQAEKSRLARINESMTTNPTFQLDKKNYGISQGEVAGLLFIMGDKKSGTVKKKYIKYWFENERLPVSLGWKPSKEPLYDSDLANMMSRMSNVTFP